jgi:hypothetical protein
MALTSVDTFTIGVFKDVGWAARGLDALERQGFPPESLSLLARASDEVKPLFERLGARIERCALEVAELADSVGCGPLVAALDDPERALATRGLTAGLKLVGFQPHDGRIYQTLVERGGVLVAVRSEPRAADALATLQAYGGGNAAIGAWHGRL